MTTPAPSRRDFLRRLCCLAASGSAAALVPQLRMIGSALASTPETEALSGYRALVCVYLAGGNDSWNMLVPYDTQRYGTYAAVRSVLALPHDQLLPLTGAAGSGSTDYALHPKLAKLRQLYDSQRLAFVVNTGTLIKPIDKSAYLASIANRPDQLYSHSDQEGLWHIGSSIDSKYGWGGRSMDQLRPQFPSGGNAQLLPCVSIAGSNKFEIGTGPLPYQMSSGGLSNLQGVCNPAPCSGFSGQRDVALQQILAQSYGDNLMGGEYRAVLDSGRSLFAQIHDGLAGADGTIGTAFPAQNSLGDQLKMVARMIKLARAQGYAQRQIYYVRYGSFDLHDGLLNGHNTLLTNLADALGAFSLAMDEIGATNDVTAFTMSEFARTLSTNGDGSDHAWGGVQFVTGGAVTGGRLYADGGNPSVHGFPDQTLDGPVSLARGQFVPGIATEQYCATLARWLGVTDAQLDAIFPNLHLFNAAYRNLGFLA